MTQRRASRRAEVRVDEVADGLHSVAISLLRTLRREDDATGLSAPRLSVLSVLVFGGPRTLGELAVAEQVKAPTMTKLVSGLEAEGLVRREPDREDRRVVRIFATARGEKILRDGRRRRVRALARRLEALTPRELQTLARSVAILRALWPRPPQPPAP